MNPIVSMGRMLLALGVLLVVAPKRPRLGRLPGDIVVRRRGFTFCFPLVTSIVPSVVVSVVLTIFHPFERSWAREG